MELKQKYILCMDTANTQITIAIGETSAQKYEFSYIDACCIEAHRASNTMLVINIDKLLKRNKINKKQILCVACGNGPGSFTGVRIALSSAKGIACALSLPLLTVSTLDSLAWSMWLENVRGHLYVVADAMRQEIYPVLYYLSNKGIERLNPDRVIKTYKAVEEASDIAQKCNDFIVSGDALDKYECDFKNLNIASKNLWSLSGHGLLKAAGQTLKHVGAIDNVTHNPGIALPVYTRLSDAEESERVKHCKKTQDLNLSGVKNVNENKIIYLPMHADDIDYIYNIEQQTIKSNPWNKNQFIDELDCKNRIWWVAKDSYKNIIGYAGLAVCGDCAEILKIAILPNFQNKGIGKKLLSYICSDSSNLGAKFSTLEVAKSNENAIKFYQSLKFVQIGQRKSYYSNGDDAIIFKGDLYIDTLDLAGMKLQTIHSSKFNEDKRKPIILAIESSCDETSAAISCNGVIVSNVTASQVDFHKRFGGVVPEIASRKHIEAICGVVDKCFEDASSLFGRTLTWDDISAIGCTYAPGLVGGLVVGLAFSKGAAWAKDIPLICVNHLEGHIYANKIENNSIEFPAIASIISGGNTLLVLVKNWGKYKTLGSTIDDAVGEAFDKISKKLGLGYPGGPIISKLASKGNSQAIKFPRAMLRSGDYKFSLSGLKTAVMTYIDNNCRNADFCVEDVCASFQQAIIDVQVSKARTAIEENNAKTFMFGGGVAANLSIRSAYEKMCADTNTKLVMTPLKYCGDNAAMIALVAEDKYRDKKFSSLDCDVKASAPLDDI